MIVKERGVMVCVVIDDQYKEYMKGKLNFEKLIYYLWEEGKG